MLENKVKRALEAIRPGLKKNGGDVEFVELKKKVVILKVTGICHNCPSAATTLLQGVEQYLRHLIPELTGVESI